MENTFDDEMEFDEIIVAEDNEVEDIVEKVNSLDGEIGRAHV